MHGFGMFFFGFEDAVVENLLLFYGRTDCGMNVK